jgi:hypothetical protein
LQDREEAMIDANYLREWARRCHFLAQMGTVQEMSYQLQVWAMEFERDADELERQLNGERPASPPV